MKTFWHDNISIKINRFLEKVIFIKDIDNLFSNTELFEYFIKKDSNYDNDDIVGYASIYLNNKEIGNEDIYIKKGKRSSKIKNFFRIMESVP